MKLGPLTVLGKLCRQNCFYMFRLTSEEVPRTSRDIYLNEIGAFRGRIAINMGEQRKDAVIDLCLCNGPEPGDSLKPRVSRWTV